MIFSTSLALSLVTALPLGVHHSVLNDNSARVYADSNCNDNGDWEMFDASSANGDGAFGKSVRVSFDKGTSSVWASEEENGSRELIAELFSSSHCVTFDTSKYITVKIDEKKASSKNFLLGSDGLFKREEPPKEPEYVGVFQWDDKKKRYEADADDESSDHEDELAIPHSKIYDPNAEIGHEDPDKKKRYEADADDESSDREDELAIPHSKIYDPNAEISHEDPDKKKRYEADADDESSDREDELAIPHSKIYDPNAEIGHEDPDKKKRYEADADDESSDREDELAIPHSKIYDPNAEISHEDPDKREEPEYVGVFQWDDKKKRYEADADDESSDREDELAIPQSKIYDPNAEISHEDPDKREEPEYVGVFQWDDKKKRYEADADDESSDREDELAIPHSKIYDPNAEIGHEDPDKKKRYEADADDESSDREDELAIPQSKIYDPNAEIGHEDPDKLAIRTAKRYEADADDESSDRDDE